MALRIGRTLPPAAAPLGMKDIIAGISGLFAGEKSVKRFENELKSYYRIRHCFAVSSGKAALALILQAMHELFPERDEVLISAYTCYSVPSAIVRAGLKVRLCDIAAGTLDFDFDLLEKKVDNPRLLCVIPTHLFGLPADVERVKNMVKGRGVFVLEDAAQAMGGEWNGKKLGTLGDAGLFSLGRGKAFSTVEGGVILTDNELLGQALAKRVTSLAGYNLFGCLKLIIYAVAISILINPWLYWLPKSLPFLKLGETHFTPCFPANRLSFFQAGVARGWAVKIDKLKKIRAGNIQEFADRVITQPGFPTSAIPDLIRFPVLISDVNAKRRILETSEALGLGISDGYPDTIDGIHGLDTCPEDNPLPRAKYLAERIVSLPVHPYVKGNDIRKIAQLLH